MRTEYNWLPAHEGATRTGTDQVGVSFSQHRGAVYEVGGRTVEGDIASGSVFVTGPEPIVWNRIRELTEALEIYLEPGLLRDAEPVPVTAGRDGTVLGVASVLRRAHVAGAVLSDVAASTLAHRLAAHLRRESPPPGGLAGVAVDRVAEYVDAHLGDTLTLDALAAVARLSPFHFARAFKATTGLAPHQFVTARRMDRALRVLVSTSVSVPDVAHAVGLSNVSHFRRTFTAHLGVRPGEVRKIRPSPRRGGV
ncbi:hypothetical protein JCM33774_52500 [Actinophytocola sp. KF-1]